MTNIVDAYLETGNFQKACKIADVKPLIATIALAKAGILKLTDKIEYGTAAQKMGGLAEEKFQQLFPEALDANAIWSRNNPIFDFNLWGLNIDVKYSSYRKAFKDKNGRTRQAYWGFRAGGKADIYFIFLENDETLDGIENAYMLLIPSSFLHHKDTVNISKNNQYFKDFKVNVDEARELLKNYAELIGDIRLATQAQKATQELKETVNGKKRTA